MNLQYKRFQGEVKAFDDKSLTIEHFISTEMQDSVGDIMLASGMKMRGHPVVLFQHGLDAKYGNEPIAKVLSITAGVNKAGVKGLIAKTQYYDGSHLNPPDATGQRLYEKAKTGVMPNWSIGFNSVSEHPVKGDRVVDEWELFEYSQVAVACNEQCTTASTDSTELKFIIKKAETMDSKKAIGLSQKAVEASGKAESKTHHKDAAALHNDAGAAHDEVAEAAEDKKTKELHKACKGCHAAVAGAHDEAADAEGDEKIDASKKALGGAVEKMTKAMTDLKAHLKMDDEDADDKKAAKNPSTKSIADRIMHEKTITGMKLIHDGMVGEMYDKAFNDEHKDFEAGMLAKAITDEAAALHGEHIKAFIEHMRAVSKGMETKAISELKTKMLAEITSAVPATEVKSAPASGNPSNPPEVKTFRVVTPDPSPTVSIKSPAKPAGVTVSKDQIAAIVKSALAAQKAAINDELKRAAGRVTN